MQLDAILEVAIGLVMMWLVLSVATMEIQNWLGQVLNTRAKFLEENILEMFKGEQSLVDKFYDHPAIKELGKRDRKGNYIKPSYIPNEVFSRVAMEILTNTSKQSVALGSESVSFSSMANGVQQVIQLNPELKELTSYLFPGIDQSGAVPFGIGDRQGRLKKYRENVETWFDHTMEQASSWYKENAMAMAFSIGLILSVAFNIDTVNIFQKLWREPTIRQALVVQADTYQLEEGIDNITQVPGYFDSLAMPVGWTSVPLPDEFTCTKFVTFTPDGKVTYRMGNECRGLVNIPATYDVMGWFTKLLGLLISAFAARQGAPFWFDLLRKLVSLRGSTQQSKKEEEAKG